MPFRVNRLIVFLICMLAYTTGAWTQINYSTSFDGCSTAACSGWTISGGYSPSITPTVGTGYSPCNTSSAKANIYSTSPITSLISTTSVGTSNGNQVTVDFSYKDLIYPSGAAANAGDATIKVYYSTTSNTGPWTEVNSFNNISSITCVSAPTTTFTPGAGDLYIKLEGNDNTGSGDGTWIVFDDISIVQLGNPCTGTPAGGTTVASANPSCQNATVTLSVTGSPMDLGLVYQWQSADDAGFTVNVTNLGTNPTQIVNPTSTKYYRRQVTCTTSSSDAYSTGLEVVVISSLSGSYTINSGLQTSTSNFQTFNDFKNALACGVSGPVVVDVVAGSGPYTEQVILPEVTGTSATNTITINGNGNVLQFTSSSSLAPSTLEFNGTDYFIVNDLHIKANGTTYAFAAHLWNGANNNTFNNCTFECNITGTNTTIVPFSISGSATTVSSAANSANETLVNGCTMIGGNYGAVFYGMTGSQYNLDNKIQNCTIRDFYSYGIYNVYCRNTTISGNTVERPNRTGLTTAYSIYLSTGSYNCLVEKNWVRKLFDGNVSSTSSAYGIYSTSPAAAGFENKIINNIISDIKSNGTIYAIYSSGNYGLVYHNTVSLDDAASTTSSGTYGIYGYGTGSSFKNNIVSITRAGTGTKYCLYFSSTNTQSSDNNVLYINAPAGTNNIGYYSGAFATLAAWKTANGGAWDQNSSDANPQFANAGTGDYTPTNNAVNNIGTNVGVVDDFNGNPRNPAFPDPGAIEFGAPPDPPCPDLSSAPDDVTIVNSVCGTGCAPSDGNISGPDNGCPAGSTMQFSTDNGATWSTTLPTYNQSGPAQTILTRCNCDSDNSQSSPASAGVTTVPGTCTTPAIPTITIVDNVCPSTTGSISATGCGTGTTLEWATDLAGSWSVTVPTYTQTAFTVYARCVDDATGCISAVASETTNPTPCGGQTTCFSEDFSSITSGDNTTTGGSSTAWAGNGNFPTVVRTYQAGGAVRIGTSSNNGSIESKDLANDVTGNIEVKIWVKGWTTIEGQLNVSIDGNTQTLSYAAKMADPFELVTAIFTGVSANSKLKIETTAKRAFIDQVEITCGIVASCPDLSSAPDDVTIVNSVCGTGCAPSGGNISGPDNGCPAGSTMQFSTDNGATWSTTLPTYNQSGPAQTILTRCNCDSDNSQSSPASAGVTTVPGTCTTPAIPTITIVDNVCPSTTGSISATGCGTGTTLEWATDLAGPWSVTVPTYTQTAFTVYARCVDDATGCISAVASETTNPTPCGGQTTCFSEDFSSITSGDNTTTGGSSTAWAGNGNFPTVVRAYQAGGAVRIGTSSNNGSIESKDLANDVTGNIEVKIWVKGWTTIEGQLNVSIDGNTQTLSYAAKMADPFELVTATFTGVSANSKLKIETTAKRAFIDQVEITCGIVASCPDLSSAPDDVTIVNSVCGTGCAPSGGNISGPDNGCPAGSTMQFSTDNGATWSTTLPTYNQSGPAQTILTRCNCDSDNSQSSPASAGVTTVPGTCTTPAIPTITIVDNVCPSTTGSISATGCGTGTTLEWATDLAGPWSVTVPTYTQTAFTVYARCVDDATGCISAVASATTAPEACSGGDCSAIFFSEYVEGSSNNKAVEIYNPTASPITLTGNASVKLYFNGSVTAGQTINLTGSIAPYGTFVVAHTSADAAILAVADLTTGNLTFNGDDAVELIFDGNTVDVIGQIGFDPGTEWGSGNTSTADNTIRRKSMVKKGDTNGSDVFDPAIEWNGYPNNTFDGLGSHYSACDPNPPCPVLTSAPDDVTIVNSVCGTGCTSSGGSISAPASGCPAGSSLQYSTDNGTTWSATLPTYNQNGPAQTILTRCNCDSDNSQSSPASAGVTTVPDICPGPAAPTITIVDNVCPSTTGSISATGCGTGTTLEWALNPSGPWSVTAPTYTNQAFTVYARCKEDISGCVSTVASATTAPTICTISDCSTIFFSEYVEGSSNNKALEIYNPTGSTVTLTGNATINVYANGAVTPNNTVNLTGTIAPYGTFVIVHSSASAPLLALANMTSNALGYNGNDAVELVYNGSSVDVIGQIGFDPGVEWGTGDASTADNTIRRKATVKKGDNSPYDAFNPSIEWDGFPIDTYSGLGSHASDCTPPCPDLSLAPGDVVIVNSTCGTGCASTGGSISAPAGGCPVGSTLVYSTDNGVTWSSTLPVYNQNGPAQTIQTRCDCDFDSNVTSPASAGVTTAPGLCPGPGAPTITITDNVCPSTTGTISGSGCGTGTTLEWALDPSGPWSNTAPAYTQTAFTVYARCTDDVSGCSSTIVSATTAPTICPPEDCSLIFFSEYIEGSSNNKALEIYNPTASVVTLSGNASVKIYSNGSNAASNVILLNGSIQPYGTFVLGHINAGPDITDVSNQLSNILNYNGDDAVELVYNGSTVDVIGQIGFDPGTEWGTGLTSTADNTLRRKSTVKIGDSNGSNAFDPSIEWDGYAIDTFDGLGSHTSECAPQCPDLTAAPDDVVVVNSTCGTGCTVSGGSISAPAGGCPVGSTLQYSTDNGTTWSATIPTYNQTGPAQTILTRCNCDEDNSVSSPASSGVTTVPGVCTPPTATAGSNSPVCIGGTINLTSTGGTSYSWSGPGGFTSALQNPSITNATSAMAGTYTVTVTDGNGCTATASTSVTVNALPTATAGSNSPVCIGGTINLTSSGGTSYSWSGPGGFTSTQQNPTRANATVAMSGAYTVTVTNANGCSATATTNVTVNALPTATASSNSPVCAGSTINLTATGGTTYSWSGPGGFTSTLQNPTRTNATAAMAGTYTVTVTSAAGCSSTATTEVIVNPLPIAKAKADPNPVCSGHFAQLYAAGGVSYAWSGPGGFTSTQQNPGLGLVQTNQAGTYTVTVTNEFGCSSTASVNLVVNESPNGSASISTQFACVGTTVQLNASGGQNYVWRGPGGFISTLPNPVINVTSHVQGGEYWVTISNSNGCYQQFVFKLEVGYPPAATASHDQSTACTGSTLKLFGSGVGTYHWSGPNGFTSTQQNPEIVNVTPANSGTYTLVVTAANGCSATATTTVNVVAPPNLTAWADDYDVCEFSTVYLHATGATNYEWNGPWGYYSTFQDPVLYYIPAYMTGTYTVTSTGPTGCAASKSFDLRVYLDINGTVSATPNPIQYGETLHLLATGGTSYLWSGPNGFYSTQPDPTIYRISKNNAGIYVVIISNEGGCELTLFVKVDVINPKGGGDNLINVTTTKIAEGKIYPNPASSHVTLQRHADVPTVYSIIDMQGRIVVKNATTENGQINIEDLAPGVYNVLWSQPDVMGDAFNGRFVKVR